MTAAERNHVRAMARSLVAAGHVSQDVSSELEDGFTSFDDAYDVLQGAAERAGFACSRWDA